MVATKSVNCHGLNSYNALERRWLPPSLLTVVDSIVLMSGRGDGCHQVVNCHGSIAIMPWRGDGCHQVC